jgi:parvulin-like peptidyl-prolyl isomerase
MGTGCSGDNKAAPLTAEQFASRNGVSLDVDGGRSAGQPVDRAGAVPYDTTERGTPTSPQAQAGPLDPNPRPDQRTVGISPAISQAVSRPSEGGAVGNGNATNGSTRPATPGQVNRSDPSRVESGPATRPANGGQPVVGGQAVGVFFVVIDVNGQPIFSDKVLQVLERPLSAEAKVNKADAFRNVAQAYIEREVLKFMNNELEIAAAEKALDKDDRQLAKAITMQWRQKQITAAGGSLEMARRKARQEGWDFDEMVEQQNRFHLVQLYYQKHIAPLTKVAAADVRAYYQQNKEKEFSTAGKSRFRLIKIDPANRKYASKADATAAAEKVLERARTEDFAKLASDPNVNDDETNRDRGGYVRKDGWVEAGSYPIDEVEKEVTALKPGQVTGIIQARNALFIAKLEEIQDAKVKPFEDLAVQEAITEKLKAQQIQAMRERHVRELQQTAVTERKPGAMKALLDIVTSRYPDWAGAKG